MAEESKQRLHQDVGQSGGLGDDQGTRVGSPTPGAGKKSGMGSEAVEGIHSADGDRAEGDRSALEGRSKERNRAGSEPIESHDTEHRSQYGGGSRPEDDTSK